MFVRQFQEIADRVRMPETVSDLWIFQCGFECFGVGRKIEVGFRMLFEDRCNFNQCFDGYMIDSVFPKEFFAAERGLGLLFHLDIGWQIEQFCDEKIFFFCFGCILQKRFHEILKKIILCFGLLLFNI